MPAKESKFVLLVTDVDKHVVAEQANVQREFFSIKRCSYMTGMYHIVMTL